MCKLTKKHFPKLGRKYRKILSNNPDLRRAATAAKKKGIGMSIIKSGLERFSCSGEPPSWKNAR